MPKEPIKAPRIIAELARFDDLTLLHRQTTHQTRLHTNIDAHHIGQRRRGRLGRRGSRHHLALHSHAPACRHLRRSQREDRPIRTNENSSWIGSLASSRHKLQQASSSLVILMDGEPSVVGGHSLLTERPHVATSALPLLPPV